jgi:hypothetical protein
MAYLDGELATDRAVEAAAHLERCEVCQELAAELRKMSQEMMAWDVEELEPEEGLPIALRAALQDVPTKSRKVLKSKGWRVLLTPRGLAWAGGALGLVLFFLVFGVSRLRYGPQYDFTSPQGTAISAELSSPTPAAKPGSNLAGYSSSNKLQKSESAPGYADVLRSGEGTRGKLVQDEEESSDHAGVPELPMIARTAGLILVAKDFDKTRASVEEILKRHSGYIGELSVSAPSDAGRTLTATLRIPASQLEAAVAELKQLGRVENESQGGEEVTQQYVDLAARLANAQHTEKRLTDILSSRTGKLQDVLKVELEIDRVRGEIEQMQAEKKELSKRVAFATLNTTVKEEYHARLEATPPSTGSRFRNAAVDGYNSVVEGFISIGLFLLSSGPSLLIWAAILFFPARWLWRKVRAELKKKQEQEA